ncbi:Lrp/AsnC family transcriptional regulator [Mucilaginibacter sp.]|uniref:Lrp/AsnC family transcriptional regulator n=1 Tax=Mucilaginibacter sp. TaxID=1882438 RepID=UPI003D13B00C
MVGGKLDDIDKKILNKLQQDARISMGKLAGLVNVTQTPVAERINKLEEHGFIGRYVTLLDRNKAGRPVLVNLFVKLDPQTSETLEKFEDVVKMLPEIQAVFVVSGAWNFILHVSARSPQDYFTFLMDHISALSFVTQTDSAFVLKECKSYGPIVL